MSPSRTVPGTGWGIVTEFGTTVIVLIAALRCVVLFAPRVVFDIDPALEPSVLAGLGPPGSLLLDALLLLTSGVVLIAGGRLSWWLLVLAVAPVPALLFHGFGGNGGQHAAQGMTWVAAVFAALALATSGDDAGRRRRLAALLLAVLAPLMFRSVLQIDVPLLGYTGPEHAETLAQYETHRDAMLADRGWSADSSSARIFERRLQQAQPTGWFVTTNILATFGAVGIVLAGGLLLAARRMNLSSGAIGAVALAGAAQLGILLATGSKGAFGALGVGLLALLLLSWPRGRSWFRGRVAVLIVALPLLVIGGIVVRSTLLPESFAGDLSLLFRGQYLQAAAEIAAKNPLTGVGPAGFQEAYVAHRPPRSPEEVASAHGAYADWIAMLGLGGLGWIILASGLLGRAVREEDEAPDHASFDRVSSDHASSPEAAPPNWFSVQALVIGAGAIGGGVAVELSGIAPADAGARLAGLGGYVLLALGLGRLLYRLPSAAFGALLGAAAVVVLVHSQIEMTLVRPGAVVWAWCLLGVAAGLADGALPERRRSATTGGALAIVLAVVVTAAFWWPARQEQDVLIRSAQQLWPVAELRQLAARARDEKSRVQLRQRAEALGASGSDLTVEGWGRFLRELEIARRRDAIRILAESERPEARRQAAKQSLLVVRWGGESEEEADVLVLQMALDRLQPLIEQNDLGAIALASTLHLELIGRDAGPHTTRAIALAQQLTLLDPNGLATWLRFADVQWETGRLDGAKKAYERVLRIDANYELDPLKQLSDRDRTRVAARSAE